MAKKKADLAPSTNILDYPNSMSQYERKALQRKQSSPPKGKTKKRTEAPVKPEAL